MIIGLSTAGYYGRMETEEAAAQVAAMGAACCEVFLEAQSEYSAAFGRLVRDRLADVPCVSVHPKGTQFENDVFGRSRRQVADALALFTGVCDAGQALGARYYVMHGPGLAYVAPPEKIYAVKERLAAMREIAGERGLTVLWENVSWCNVRTVRDVAAVRDLAPEMGFVLDVKQARRAGQDVGAMARAMGSALRHVHVLDDAADGRICLPGDGRVDWPGFFALLREIGFDGAVMLEPYSELTAKDDDVRRALDVLRAAGCNLGKTVV